VISQIPQNVLYKEHYSGKDAAGMEQNVSSGEMETTPHVPVDVNIMIQRYAEVELSVNV